MICLSPHIDNHLYDKPAITPSRKEIPMSRSNHKFQCVGTITKAGVTYKLYKCPCGAKRVIKA